MAILVSADTRVVCQGMTGRAGTFHAARMLSYGTKLVAGVTPGKGGRTHLDLPIFESVGEAMRETGANASIIFVPPLHAASAILEAIAADLPLVVCVTERIPVLDVVRVRQALAKSKSQLIGPNSQGILAPGITQIGVMSTIDARRGRVGIVSRSASLTSEIVLQTTMAGLGQSTTIGVGGDPIHGIDLKSCVELFIEDPETDGIIVIGEIGGTEEEDVAALVKRVRPSKPIVGFVAGRHAPPERRMGHAGAFATGSDGGASTKIAVLRGAGVRIASNANNVGETMRRALAGED